LFCPTGSRVNKTQMLIIKIYPIHQETVIRGSSNRDAGNRDASSPASSAARIKHTGNTEPTQTTNESESSSKIYLLLRVPKSTHIPMHSLAGTNGCVTGTKC
jgi:hypothetical protein